MFSASSMVHTRGLYQQTLRNTGNFQWCVPPDSDKTSWCLSPESHQWRRELVLLPNSISKHVFCFTFSWGRGWRMCRWGWTEVTLPSSLPTIRSAPPWWHIMCALPTALCHLQMLLVPADKGKKNTTCRTQGVCRQPHLHEVPSVAGLGHKTNLTYFALLAPDTGKCYPVTSHCHESTWCLLTGFCQPAPFPFCAASQVNSAEQW